IRVTNHGKLHAWVEFALQFLENNPDRPLTFHTMPPARIEHPTEDATEPPSEAQPNETPPASSKKPRIHTSTTTIPRLISVVEIVKREYLKALDPALALSGNLSGLHQYNQIGELEQPDEPQGSLSAEEQRQRDISQALSGKRYLRQHKIAYMKVTLSRKELPDLVPAGATYQQPEVRALSKSARTRLKRRRK
ncbi:hypothetical protein FOMPIDRAFT_1107769, partial [Fomitopsis schrenkii]